MTTHNTIGKGSVHRAVNGGNDAYFTKPTIASRLSAFVLAQYPDAEFIEPSAGNGAFVRCFPSIVAYDLNPKAENIIRADWFDVAVPNGAVIVGNPPFGFSANLAIRFFNHAATGARAICFIVPRSFQKVSIQRRLHASFHLVHEEVLPDNAFTLDGADYSVPCVFQVWERYDTVRTIDPLTAINPYIEFCKQTDATHAIRRVGGRAGQVLDGVAYNVNTTLFFKLKRKNALKVIAAISPAILQVRNHTAGVRSVSKNEIAALLNAYAMGTRA